jgi:hypothetical protein
MEATLGISLYNYIYLKVAKTICLSYDLCFLFNKIENKRAEQVLHGGGGRLDKERRKF